MKSFLNLIYLNISERKSWVILLVFIAVLMSVQTYISKNKMPEAVDFSSHTTLFIDSHNLNEQDKKPDITVLQSSSSYVQIADPSDSIILQQNERLEQQHSYVEEKDSDTILLTFELKEDEKHYEEEKKYSLAEKTKEEYDGKDYKKPKSTPILIDINTADDVQLQYIKGIGPSFASRIIKYRDLVGGFHSISQLMEVYGIDRDKYMGIKDQVTISGNTQKINLNSAEYQDLAKHPYITYQEAKLIIAYYKKHGPYRDAFDIVKIGVMDSSYVKKLLPYLPDSLVHYKAQAPLTSL